ncbi:hypothetical protein ACC719_11595 [Rhizobium ruizarguesonis]
MRMRYLPVSVLLFMACAAAPAIAQPAACLTKTDDGGLQGSGGTIVTYKKEFYESSKAFPVQTYSDQAPTGKTAEFCLRYEIENIGQDHIQNLYWGLPGIFVKDFRPGAADRQSRSSQLLSTKDPEELPTLLNAFAKKEAVSKAWMVETQTALAAGTQFAEVVPVDGNQFLPADVRRVLEANSILQRKPLLVINLDQDKPIYPIRETVSGQGLNLEVTSRVLRDGDSVSFQTDVSLNGEGAGKAKLSMPALQALEDTRGAGSPDYYESYLRSVEKQGAELSSDFKEHRFSTTMSRKSLLQDALFLSEHVIKVQANDNEYCYRFQSYTPFAVDFDLDRCNQ